MKQKFLFGLAALSSLLMAGCSDDDILKENPDGSSESTTSYLSVNLLSSDPTTSRADDDYENGSLEENKVNKVRFYFFTNSGAAANVKVKDGAYVNYYDWTPESGDQSAGSGNVGSKLKAQLVIETPKGDKLPAQIVAVINPAESASSRSLSDLKLLQKDYASADYTQAGKFVMFNSVYGNSTKTAEVCAVGIKEENLAKTADEAKKHPVVLYVERSVAKVQVEMAVGFDATTNMLALKNKDKDEDGNDVDLTVGGEQVYLKINGWKLAAETDKGNLVKKINISSWNDSPFSSWWNNSSNYRSCWAVNATDADNKYWSYNEIKTNGSKTALYTNENADNNKDQNLNATKVILSGTLCKANGDAFTIVRHVGSYFADTYSTSEPSNLPELKKNILAQLEATTKYYWKDGDNFKQIAPSDIKIVAEELDEKENTSAHDCFVYAQLTDEAKGRKWYDSKAEDATALADGSNDINAALKGTVDKALVWREGMTYYYYEIIHHTDDDDTKTPGVVRNHVYKTKVIKIAGLGTPVYDPDQKIYPEKPDPNDHYIAAQINILSWHIVTDDYELEW